MQRTVAILSAVLGSGLMSLAACSSSSGGATNGDGGSEGTDGAASGSGGGSSGSSGTSSGGSSGGTSSGGSSSGTGSSSGSTSSSSGGSSGGDPMLVGGRPNMNGLMLIGTNLYWIEAKSGIFSVPVTGGTAKSVYMNANVNAALGSDGTHFFFTQTTGSGSEVDMVNLDGTGEQAIASGVFAFSAANDGGPQIFVINDTVYVNGTSNIMTISLGGADGGTDGGGVTGTVISGSNIEVQALYAADTSNIYFSDFTGGIYSVPTAGGTPTMLFTTPALSGNATAPGDLSVISGTVYMLTAGTANQTVNLLKSTGGAAGTTLTTYTMENANRAGLALDGNGGLYEFVGGDKPGIYDATTAAGAQTAVYSDMYALSLGNMVGSLHAIDSAHIYYAAVGGGMYSIYSHAK